MVSLAEDSPNAPQAPGPPPPSESTAGSEAAHELSHLVEGDLGAGGLIPNECPSCGKSGARVLFTATDRLYLTTSKTFQIVECSQCRLIRLHPRPAPDEIRNYYPPAYWFTPKQTTAARLEQIYRRLVLRDHLKFVHRALRECEEEGIVLDVGCGGGLFLQMLAERGAKRVVGLDFSLDAASLAWGRARVPAVCGDLSNAPLAPSSCAAVTMFHVLEHLYDPASYLNAAHRLLRPDGRLVVQVPNAASWQFLIMGERWSGIDVPRHLTDFRAKDLEALLDRCGFEVLRLKYFSLRDNPAGMATSLAPNLDPMARQMRQQPESPRAKLAKDLVYFGVTMMSLPFTLLEAACRAGSTVMVEARKKS